MVDADSNVSSRLCNLNAGTSSSAAVVEEESGVLKSGPVTATYGKSSKKSYYAVLSERALELHESEKTYKKKKNAKILIDLSNCFNVAQHYDPKLKQCISIMSPDETLLMCGENEKQTNDWYDSVISATIPARAMHLGRPVFQNELFECAWDVNIVTNPKLKKPVPNPENFPNLGIKKPEWAGFQRLCFYPHTIILCKMKIGPAMHGLPKTMIPPFRMCDFIELQRQFIANFGFQEKYFIMRIGRSSPIGSCEIWAQCDSEEIACEVHNKLNEIIEREAEKKKKGLPLTSSKLNTISERRNTPHHSRHGSMDHSTAEPILMTQNKVPNYELPSTSAHQQPPVQKKSILKSVLNPVIPEKPELQKAEFDSALQARSSTTPLSAREKRSMLRELKARVDSFDEEIKATNRYYEQQQAIVYDTPINKNIEKAIEMDINRVRRKSSMGAPVPNAKSLPNHVVSYSPQKRANSVSGNDPTSSFGGTSIMNYLRKLPEEKTDNKSLDSISLNNVMNPVVEWARHRASLASGTSAGEEETEDSGGTLRVDYDENRSINSSKLSSASSSHRRFIQAPVEHHSSFGSLAKQKRKDSRTSLSLNNRMNNLKLADKNEIEMDTFHYDRESTSTTDESSSMGDLTGLSPNSRKRLTTNETSCSENLSTTSSVSTCHSSAHEDPTEYTLMDKVDGSCSSGSVSHLVVPSQFDHHYNLDEARSYVSDSSDSCYSSMTTNGYLNAPRAYSFSSQILSRRLNPQSTISNSNNRVSFAESLEDATTSDEAGNRKPSGMRNNKPPEHVQQNLLLEDLRKRAFSVGSNWFARPFKFSYNNIARLKPSSKSGSSSVINDSELDERGSKQNVANAANSSRQPSVSSFTSTSSTSAQRHQSNSSSIKKRQNLHFDDLIELNFSGEKGSPCISGGASVPRHSKGSINSIESPIRSRNNSFGVNCSVIPPTKKYAEDAYIVGEVNRPIAAALHLDLENPYRKPFLEDEPFVLEEVKCFMSPTDRESVAAITSKDSISLRSHKSGSPNKEHSLDNVSGRSSRNSINSKCSMNRRSNPSIIPQSAPFMNNRKKSRHASASDSKSESFLMCDASAKPKSSNTSLRSLPRSEETIEDGEKHERKPNEKAFGASVETDYVQLETPEKYLKQVKEENFQILSTIAESQVSVGEI